jgi:hypothetical protein
MKDPVHVSVASRQLFNILNARFPSIAFTLECDTNHSIQFRIGKDKEYGGIVCIVVVGDGHSNVSNIQFAMWKGEHMSQSKYNVMSKYLSEITSLENYVETYIVPSIEKYMNQ